MTAVRVSEVPQKLIRFKPPFAKHRVAHYAWNPVPGRYFWFVFPASGMHPFRSFAYLPGLFAGLLALACSRDYPATYPYTPPTAPPKATSPGPTQSVTFRRLFLANDKVRLGIDLGMGGAISYLSEAGSKDNMVNNADLGRQLQTSLYGGPYPYSVNGKQPVYEWRNLGWNPVQTGDYYNHPSQVLTYTQTANSIYVKSIPKIWPLFNEPADCVMEHWYTIQGNTVQVRSRTTMNRADTTQYEGRTQEAPCAYLNAPYYRFVTYTGAQPFTSGPVSEFTNRDNTTRIATENWFALLNADGRGVGLYKPGEVRYATMGFGTTGYFGTEYDQASGYMSAGSHQVLDYNGQYEFSYTLIVGSLADIRQYVYTQPAPAAGPTYRFNDNPKDGRQSWYYFNTTDTGWPIRGELAVRWARIDPIRDFYVLSPYVMWRAADVSSVYVQAAFQTRAQSARFNWRSPSEAEFYVYGAYHHLDFPIINDGQYHTYELRMGNVPDWTGVIQQICLSATPGPDQSKPGALVRIRSVTMTPP